MTIAHAKLTSINGRHISSKTVFTEASLKSISVTTVSTVPLMAIAGIEHTAITMLPSLEKPLQRRDVKSTDTIYTTGENAVGAYRNKSAKSPKINA